MSELESKFHPIISSTEKIFILQEELIGLYVKVEGLPKPPLRNINSKESQALIRDFIGRVTEELSESWEKYLLVREEFERVRPTIISFINSKDSKEDESGLMKLRQLLIDFNAEIADVTHFLVEVLIYSNIGPEELRKWVQKTCPDIVNEKPDIVDWMSRIACIFYGTDGINRKYLYLPFEDEPLIAGAKKVAIGSSYDMESTVYPSAMWNIIYQLNLAKNCLKNKPWKQKEVETDIDKYQQGLARAFFNFCHLLGLLDINSEGLYRIYHHKNLENKNRIKTKY